MAKQVIRLTEGDFHKIIEESVNIVLNEAYGTQSQKSEIDRLNFDAYNSFSSTKGSFSKETQYGYTTLKNGLRQSLNGLLYFMGDNYESNKIYKAYIDKLNKNLAQSMNIVSRLGNILQMESGSQPSRNGIVNQGVMYDGDDE